MTNDTQRLISPDGKREILATYAHGPHQAVIEMEPSAFRGVYLTQTDVWHGEDTTTLVPLRYEDWLEIGRRMRWLGDEK